VSDLDAGTVRRFELPAADGSASTGGGGQQPASAYERGILSLAFSDESTLYSSGDGGVRRWNLDTGAHEVVIPSPPGASPDARFSLDRRAALLFEMRLPGETIVSPVRLLDLPAATSREVTAFGPFASLTTVTLDTSGRVAASGSRDGIVRVGRLDGGPPHVLAGHKGVISAVAISPDLRWVASSGEDGTLRLWPMPDLSKPPLHTLPLDQLLAKLRSLTNLRAVADPASATGWTIEVGPFPGWRDVPTW
jgi:hypothetical protein